MKTLCLDFDGVIHSYTSGWQGADFIPDPPVPGAMKFILEAMKSGYEVVIYSSRSHQDGGIKAMVNWMRYWLKKELSDSDFSFVVGKLFDFNKPHPGFPTSKPSAYVTIDDRALTFNGDWKEMAQKIQNFQPWNKK